MATVRKPERAPTGDDAAAPQHASGAEACRSAPNSPLKGTGDTQPPLPTAEDTQTAPPAAEDTQATPPAAGTGVGPEYPRPAPWSATGLVETGPGTLRPGTDWLPDDEPTVPAWCAGLMEGSLWLAILVATLFSATSAAGTVQWICTALVVLSAIAWGFHWVVLRRSTILLSLPLGLFVLPLLVIYFLTLISGLGGETGASAPEAHALIGASSTPLKVVLCVLVFVIVSGAFTERQAARLCAFLGGLGVVEALAALHLLGPEYGPRSGATFSFWPRQVRPHVSGTLGTEWALGALLLCGLVGAATFAAYAIAAGAPSRHEVHLRSRMSWLGSRGAGKGLVAIAAVVTIVVTLFLVELVLIVPICVVSLVLFLLLLALTRRLGPLAAAMAIAACLAFGLASLARPTGVKWGISGAVLERNVGTLLAGMDARAEEGAINDADAGVQPGTRPSPARQGDVGQPPPAAGKPQARAPAPHDDEPATPADDDEPAVPADDDEPAVPVRDGDIVTAGRRTVWLVTALLVGLVGCLVLTAGRGMIRFDGNQPILAAGALAAVVGVTLFALIGHCLGHLGLALSASAFCAIAAAGGDFEQEFEEQ